jgi:YHS domain-containing protein
MGGLFALLLFAGLFYVMMRWGCGAHAVHGRGGASHAAHLADAAYQGGQDVPRSAAPKNEDPVCGRIVAADAGYTVTHAGREYRLCSRACVDTFESDPNRYAIDHGGKS